MTDGRYGKPNIDHNHETKRPRGLLCTTCNKLLGYAYDSVDILQAAVRYLRKYQ
jgi:hypothetical protein